MDINVKCKIIKLLEDTTENLDDFGCGDDFLDTTSRALSMEEIIDKLDLSKLKKLLLCERQCQENKKTNHRMEENISKEVAGM